MSVLIKGMKMPKNCTLCFMRDNFHDYCPYEQTKERDCPLVEVPTPHGPLVDTKNLLETIRRGAYFIRLGYYKTDFGMTCFSIAQAIHEQPIIIEAEEGADHE